MYTQINTIKGNEQSRHRNKETLSAYCPMKNLSEKATYSMVLNIGPSRKGKATETVKRLVLVKGLEMTDEIQGIFRARKLFCMIL